MKELLLHSLVVSPIVRWIASPRRRWSRKTGIRIAFICLVAMALLQLRRMELNCYELIGVSPEDPPSVLSRTFRKRSGEFHPDRPRASTDLPFGFDTTNDVFIHLQKCHETITNPGKLSHYNRFGKLDFAYKNEGMILPVMAVFAIIGYLVNFVVCSVFTAAPESQSSRFWIYSFLLFAMGSEMYMKFLGQSNLFGFIPYFSKWMVFEQVEAIKALIPSMLSSGLLLAQLTHVDDSEMTQEIIQAVSNSNREIAAHVVNKRNSLVTPIVPAVIRLMHGPVKPVIQSQHVAAPSGGLGDGAKPVEENQESTNTAPSAQVKQQQGFDFQRIFNWLFYAYVIKIVVSSLRSSLGI